MRAKLLSVAALITGVLASPVCAGWNQASSEHFLIYSRENAEPLRQFAEQLEKFDGAVRALRGMDDIPLSRGNRVTIFVVSDEDEVRRLIGDKSGFVAGFYRGSAAGSIAVVPQDKSGSKRVRAKTGSRLDPAYDPDYDLGADTILLHEYSHHLMMQALSTPYPEWLVEGFAEFMSTARFERDGSVGLGLPAKHRAFGLTQLQGLPLEALLSGQYDKITLEQRESIYGRGWLLTHYLSFDQQRSGQLVAYLAAIARGGDPLQAARQAFGDLKQLDHDLDAYLRRSRLEYRKVSGAALQFAPIQVSALSDGGSAVMPLLVELKNGVDARNRDRLQAAIRATQSKFPGDPLVETTAAEIELEAGNPAESIAASHRALKADAGSTDAMILKGKALMAQARKSTPPKQDLYVSARRQFMAANKIDPEDPEPLMEYYFSFVTAGMAPTANAVEALHYASDLAPQDVSLRLNSALQYLSENKLKDARLALAPIAFDPHGRQTAAVARAMIGKIDVGDADGAQKAAMSGGS